MHLCKALWKAGPPKKALSYLDVKREDKEEFETLHCGAPSGVVCHYRHGE